MNALPRLCGLEPAAPPPPLGERPALAPLALPGPRWRPSVAPEPPPYEPAALQALLDAIDYGTVLVDRTLGVVWANRLGRRWLRTTPGIGLREGHLTVADPRLATDLQRAVRDAIDRQVQSLVTAQGQAIAAAPTRSSVGRPLATLLLERPEVCSAFTLAAFARRHRLSPAEAAVLEGLGRGDAPEDIARRHGVALSTVRTQVHSIRAKTGVPSVRELVIRLSRIPPLAPALEDDSSRALR